MSTPFSTAASNAGAGTIHLALLLPSTPRLKTLNYQYPLKLISPAPSRTEENPHHLVHTVYLLTYGGGLVAGDAIDLSVTVEQSTRLILLTQGSTKLFKSPARNVTSQQRMTVAMAKGSALCYLPDPVQPFERSSFEQRQTYNISGTPNEHESKGSICVLDWVSNGRPANGEDWSFYHYSSKNEIWSSDAQGGGKLLLRDSVTLDDGDLLGGISLRMGGLAVYGTLMLHGPLFEHLGEFFMNEFHALPRIGARKWDSGSDSGDDGDIDATVARRAERQRTDATEGLLWSTATVRGCVVVKFGAREIEHGRRWLRTMLLEEGSVVREFGQRALLCLR